jgi:hypothetical protein
LKAKILHIYMVTILIVTLFLLVILVGFEILPTINGNDDPVIQRLADLQLVRGEFISRDALFLQYRPVTNHSQAISDLQTILPTFQQVQAGLLHGDASLGLPSNPPDSVKAALLSADSDYRQIVTAAKNILASSDQAIDPIQVNIILMHDRPYLVAMYGAITLIQQDADARKVQLLIIRISFIVAAMSLVTLKYLFFTRPAVKRVALAEVQTNAENERSRPPPVETL